MIPMMPREPIVKLSSEGKSTSTPIIVRFHEQAYTLKILNLFHDSEIQFLHCTYFSKRYPA